MNNKLLNKITYRFSGDQKPFLISIHIPKTGGRSFYELLKLVYGAKVDPRTKREDFFPDESKKEKITITKDISVLHGHFHFPEIQHLTGPQTKLVTWLREPADRVISNYYFLMFRIQSGKVKPEQRDKQSYSLMDYAKMDSQKNVMKKFLGDSDLDDYFFAGDFHEYAKEINHLLNRLGYKGKVPEIHENKTHDLNIYKLCTTQPGDITDTMKDEIREMNQADIHLYNTMLELKKRRGEPEAALNKRTH